MKKTPQVIRLKDYRPSDFLIDQVYLHFDLHETKTIVKSILQIRRAPKASSRAALCLNGEDLNLKTVILDGRVLSPQCYQVDAKALVIKKVPKAFTLETKVEIDPKNNTKLSGLYISKGIFCSHCEAEGFRRITYFIDRPDVLSYFKVGMSADQKTYPYLLANGNLVEEKKLANGKKYVLWEDPSLKPCYLFALVAGDLDVVEDHYKTFSGRTVRCAVYVEKGYRDQAGYALGALKRAMKWDEEVYNREYELNRYMIVAVDDFNAGAMENKGLNIFNSKYILAKQETASDVDYMNIERVVGHEYFHNWSGNRVTVQEWFEITLKEGLTTFREQSFSAQMTSPALVLLNAVTTLRMRQFPEDQGPLSHPIRPKSYMEINNFYTTTVYEKGAEVIRMIETILGKPAFVKALQYYFDQYDGKAITTEDFILAMEKSSKVDLKQFRLWYDQSGTPHVKVSSKYHAAKKTLTLQVEQFCAPTPEQKTKKPFHIPLAVAIFKAKGEPMTLRLKGEKKGVEGTRVLNIKKKKESYSFQGIDNEGKLSLLRNFSAPVVLDYQYSDESLIWLMENDDDPFCRWEAQQIFLCRWLLKWIEKIHQSPFKYNPQFTEIFSSFLCDKKTEKNLLAKLLVLPSESYLLLNMKKSNIEKVHTVYSEVKLKLASDLEPLWDKVYHKHVIKGDYLYTTENMGKRAVKNVCLLTLLELKRPEYFQLAFEQFMEADNMTDKMGALAALNSHDCKERQKALEVFYKDYQKDAVVIDKWFALQASSTLPDTLRTVKKLMNHSAFNIKNPNKVRALIGSFSQNVVCFHDKTGAGYQFLAEQVIAVDKINPSTAAKLVDPLVQWKKFDKPYQQLMKEALRSIRAEKGLSRDVYEVVSKGLK